MAFLKKDASDDFQKAVLAVELQADVDMDTPTGGVYADNAIGWPGYR